MQCKLSKYLDIGLYVFDLLIIPRSHVDLMHMAMDIFYCMTVVAMIKYLNTLRRDLNTSSVFV